MEGKVRTRHASSLLHRRPYTICNVADYGGSWRRLVLERHLQEYLENVDPVVADYQELSSLFKMCAEHVRRLDIRQLRREVPVALPETVVDEDPPANYLSDHLNLRLYLPELQKLEVSSLDPLNLLFRLLLPAIPLQVLEAAFLVQDASVFAQCLLVSQKHISGILPPKRNVSPRLEQGFDIG